MTICELIKSLKELPENAPIFILTTKRPDYFHLSDSKTYLCGIHYEMTFDSDYFYENIVKFIPFENISMNITANKLIHKLESLINCDLYHNITKIYRNIICFGNIDDAYIKSTYSQFLC